MCPLFIARETRPSWHPLIETAAVAKTTRNQRAIILPRGHGRVSADLPRLVASHALDFYQEPEIPGRPTSMRHDGVWLDFFADFSVKMLISGRALILRGCRPPSPRETYSSVGEE